MSKKTVFVISLFIVFTLALSACATATQAPVVTEAPVAEATEAPAVTEAPAAEAPQASAALKITGKVDSEMAWSEDEVKAMKTTDAESTNSQGSTETYTGVLLSDLLALAKPQSDATTLVLVADDGYTAEVALADVMACTNCILSFRNKGGFSSVLPTFAKSLQVKGVIEIQVK